MQFVDREQVFVLFFIATKQIFDVCSVVENFELIKLLILMIDYQMTE